MMLNSEKRYQCISEMTQFIDENNIHNFYDLYIYAMHNRHDWFDVLCHDKNYALHLYINSCRYKDKKE